MSPHSSVWRLAAIVLLFPCWFCSRAPGAAGDVDPSFDPGSGVNGPVSVIAVQPDGKVIIAGGFTTVRGLARPGLARLNPDGSGDGSFNPAFGGSRWHPMGLQADGKVLLGSTEGLRRLNPDGSEDTGFRAPSLADYDLFHVGLNTMAFQTDGKILIGGGFRVVGGTLRSGIARLNSDGSLDDSFVPETSDNFWAGVDSIAVQRDGKILIGGYSMTVDSASVARLNPDGSRDFSFIASTDGAVWEVALQPDGKVLMGGAFQSVNDRVRMGVARLLPHGALDEDFIPGADAAGLTLTLALQDDGRIITGRYSTGASGSKLSRLNSDGSVDDSFGQLSGIQPSIFALAVQADGKVLAGGVDIAGNSNVASPNTLVRINPDGSRDATFHVTGGVGGTILTLAAQPDGKVLIGGTIGPSGNPGIARLNRDGNRDESFRPAPELIVDGRKLLLQPDGKVLVGGRSISVDAEGAATGRGEITRLHSDGTLDASFRAGVGVPGGFELMALQPDGGVLVCGEITVDEVLSKTLRRLNHDGSADASFRTLVMDFADINCVTTQTDGKVLVGGRFSIHQDPNVYSLIRLAADGTLDASFRHAFTPEMTGIDVRAILTRADGMILVAGALPGSNGLLADTIHRLHADGSVDGSFDPGPGISIYTATTDGGGIAWQPDGKVIASGYYRPETEEYYNGPIRLNLDGGLDRSFNHGSGYFAGNYCLELEPDGALLVGGPFLTIRGVFRPYIARLYGDPPRPVAFAAWVAGFGLAGADAAAHADPDQDGVGNATEYVMGTNPSQPDSTRQTTATMDGGHLRFVFSRDDKSESPGTVLTVESGTDLVTWPMVLIIGSTTDFSSPGVTVSENGSAPDTIAVAIPAEPSGRVFARWRVAVVP